MICSRIMGNGNKFTTHGKVSWACVILVLKISTKTTALINMNILNSELWKNVFGYTRTNNF